MKSHHLERLALVVRNSEIIKPKIFGKSSEIESFISEKFYSS